MFLRVPLELLIGVRGIERDDVRQRSYLCVREAGQVLIDSVAKLPEHHVRVPAGRRLPVGNFDRVDHLRPELTGYRNQILDHLPGFGEAFLLGDVPEVLSSPDPDPRTAQAVRVQEGPGVVDQVLGAGSSELVEGIHPHRPPSIAATSATVWPIGPIVSRLNEIPIVPERLMRPRVGFRPTIPHKEDGITVEPYVSSPMAPAAKLEATAAADPELE